MFTYSFLFLTLKFVIIKSTEIMKEPSSAVKKQYMIRKSCDNAIYDYPENIKGKYYV